MKNSYFGRRGFFTLEQKQDVRSLAAFRILAGAYVMYDILSRLQHGRFSLLWYTSTENSFLLPDDTPHRSPVHRIWFYRGSEMFQLCLFFVTFLLALSFSLGYKCNVVSKTLLWLNVVAMQCRCMPPHDGSDTFLRHLLLWSIQLPMSRVWSIDSMRGRSWKWNDYSMAEQNNSYKLKSDVGVGRKKWMMNMEYCEIHNRAAVWGIRLQIIIMYIGTVMHRTVDSYGWLGIHKSKWLPPQLTAVHYALNSSFSPRECWLGDFVRTNLIVSQSMTLMAMVFEGFAPIFCLIMGEKTHIPAFVLFKLHFGLLVLMNLPNWQFVGMIASVIWLPSWVWNSLQRTISLKFPTACSPPHVEMSPESLKKKDIYLRSEKSTDNQYSQDSTHKVKTGRRRRPLLSYFFLSYMLYDFAGNRHWFHKIDDGDIGEFLRFSQYWVMFSGPATTGNHIMITGSLNGRTDVNVWEWIKNENNVQVVDMDIFQKEIWTNMTHVYPSPRIERAMSEWHKDKKKTEHFLNSLCTITPFTTFTFIARMFSVRSPGAEVRLSKEYADRIVQVTCD